MHAYRKFSHICCVFRTCIARSIFDFGLVHRLPFYYVRNGPPGKRSWHGNGGRKSKQRRLMCRFGARPLFFRHLRTLFETIRIPITGSIHHAYICIYICVCVCVYVPIVTTPLSAPPRALQVRLQAEVRKREIEDDQRIVANAIAQSRQIDEAEKRKQEKRKQDYQKQQQLVTDQIRIRRQKAQLGQLNQNTV